jgi:hypothetical protein
MPLPSWLGRRRRILFLIRASNKRDPSRGTPQVPLRELRSLTLPIGMDPSPSLRPCCAEGQNEGELNQLI